jgi:hypothetical protein
LAIASTTIEIKPTKCSTIQSVGEVQLNLVRIWEPKPPRNAPAVEWLVFTSEPASTQAELMAIVDMYRASIGQRRLDAKITP